MRTLITAALALGLGGLTAAQDKKEKADPNGTWKCETDVGGQKRESTLKLKLDGDKLTGTITFADKTESKIEGGKFKDGEVTFTAVRELMDQKFTVKYTAKVDGDSLKGKAEADVGGQAQSFDFTGKRAKEEKKKD